MNSITEYPKRFDVETQILAYWLLFASRPRDAEPDETGAYFIGTVENAPEKSWARPIGPYSLAQPK